MESYNYKVIAELKDNLTDTEEQTVLAEIEDLKKQFHIINLDRVTYVKEQPISGKDDFGCVALFFCKLKKKKHLFDRLEAHDLPLREVLK